MARVVGNRDEMRVHMYGVMSDDTRNYIQSRINNISSMYGSESSWFVEELNRKFNQGAMKSLSIAQSNLKRAGGLFDDSLYSLYTINDFRSTSRINQCYILSNPYIEREWVNKRIEAWGYIKDRFKKLNGEDNPYYQNAIDGLNQYGDESFSGEVDYESKFVIYSNDDLDKLKPLRINESLIIRNNWNRLYNLLNDTSEDAEDPTSVHGAYL